MHCHFNSDTNNGGFVVNHKNFLQVGKEQVRKFNMSRMSYILCNTFCTLKGRFKKMSEALMQVFNAHILAPVRLKERDKLRSTKLGGHIKPVFQ
jgi:hypothetical protein